MKKFILLLSLSVFMACNSNKDAKGDSATASTNDSANITYPITAEYSPTWKIGNPQYSVMLLNMYKAWDDGNIDAFKTIFADSVELYWANGDIMKGPRDSIIASVKAYRDQYSSIKNTVHGFLSMKHKDTGEDWFIIWTKEFSTTKQGKVDSIELQENWRINKEGKTDLAYQYDRNFKPSK